MAEPQRSVSWRWPLVALGFLAALWRCAQVMSDSDTGFHLALGRIFASGSLPKTNALAWTALDHPWYPTSWLYDLGVYLAVRAAGPVGAQLVAAGLVGITGIALFLGLREALGNEGQAPAARALALATGLLLLVPRIGSRSYLVTWAVLAGTLALGLAAQKRGWKWRLLALPLLAVGSNAHTGACFSAGVLGLFCIEAAIRERKPAREAAIALAGVLALLANPGGTALLGDLFAHLKVEDLVPLAEYRRPELAQETAFFVLLVPAALAMALERRRIALVGATVAFALFGLRTVRFCWEFFIVALPLLAFGWQRILERLPKRAALGFSALVVVLAGAQAVTPLREAPIGAGFDARGLPVRAAAFAKREGLSGRLYNAYHDGGYLAWALDQPIFQDGRPRAFPPEFWRRSWAVDRSPEEFRRWMQELGVEWAITAAYPTALTGNGLLDQEHWAVVYWDEVNEVFLRRDVPRFAGEIASHEYKLFRRSADPYEVIVRTIANGSEEVLAAYERELDRYARDNPGDAFATIARCYLDRRRGRPTAPACAGLP